MANPRPTASQLAMIAGGAGAGAVRSLGVLVSGGAIGDAIIGIGAAIGAVPYSRAIQEQKKRQGGG